MHYFTLINPKAGKHGCLGPGVDSRPLPAWGLYARGVQALTLEDARFSLAADDFRPVIHADGVERLTLDNFKFTRVAGITEPITTPTLVSCFNRNEDWVQ